MPNNERSEKIQQAKNTIERMLRYAASNPTIVLPNETLNRVHSKTQKPRIQITFCEEINWRCYVPPCLL